MTLDNTPSPVDVALVTLVSADTDPDHGFMALCPGGLNHLVAPEDVADPYCVFGLTIPSSDTYTMTGLAYSVLTYGLDVIQEGGSAERAQTAQARLFTLLNDQEANLNAVMPTGWAVLACRRSGYAERLERTEGGVLYQHIQAIYTVTIRPA
jgi:hypothetical protein